MESDVPYSYPLRGAISDSTEDAKEELRILRALAAGKHPVTGTSLPDDSCYQSAKVLRALLAAIKVLEKTPRMRKLPPKAGKPWTVEEDTELGKYFDQGMTIPDLAHKHERTRGAIGTRLEKPGKIKLYTPLGTVRPSALDTAPEQK